MGQATLAWHLSRAQEQPLAAALARCAVLALHDLAVLLGLGLAAALVNSDPRVQPLRWVCGSGFILMTALNLGMTWLPPRWRQRRARWAGWVQGWSWRDSLTLAGLRLVLFVLLGTYVVVGLGLIGIGPSTHIATGVVPLSLVAEAMPSVSGLGSRDAALLAILHPGAEEQARVLGFTLIWSTGLMVCRLLIGVVACWFPIRS